MNRVLRTWIMAVAMVALLAASAVADNSGNCCSSTEAKAAGSGSGAQCCASPPQAAHILGQDLKWEPAPHLPEGAKIAYLYTDPVTKGVEALYLYPAHYKLPLHKHSVNETLVILSGDFKVEAAGSQYLLTPKSFFLIPAGLPHAAESQDEDVILYSRTNGPKDVIWVTPEGGK